MKIVPANSSERRKLQKSEEMIYGVIQTPDLLYDKHIITKLSRKSAINLSLTRFQDHSFQAGLYIKVNTVFKEPEKFYEYPEFDFIISSEPVKVYKVQQVNDRPPTVHYLGKKWAIFKSEQQTYHFDPLVYQHL